MPTYEYKCESCNHQFDVYQSMNDEKLFKCPSCGQNSLKRLIGIGGGLIFKGSGFYLTDYKNKPQESSSSESSDKKSDKKESVTQKPESTTLSESKTQETNSKSIEKKTTKVKSKNQ